MRFRLPNFPCEFDIPDDWLAEGGIDHFSPTAPGYRSTADAQLVSLKEVTPSYREPDYPMDWCGFDRVRLSTFSKALSREPRSSLSL